MPTTTADLVTATATSRRPVRKSGLGVLAAAVLGAGAILLLSAISSSRGSRVTKTGTQAPDRSNAFSWLEPRPAPTGWVGKSIESGGAVLFHPPGWTQIHGDRGTVSFSLRDGRGLYRGYLNVTPRQGAERLARWASFRTNRNRAEGDRRVRERAAAEGLRFANASGSCVIDEYLSRVGSNPYTELACITSGRRYTNVFIGAALTRDWPRLAPLIKQAASSLVER